MNRSSVARGKTPRSARATRARETHKSKPDFRLIYLTVILAGVGMLMIYSASAVLAAYKGYSPFHFFLLQGVWLIISIIAAYIAYKIPLQILPKLSVPIMVVTIILLVLVLIIGVNLNGATRWIAIGSFTLQPSEVAKLGFVIYLSAWLAKPRPEIKDFREKVERHLKYDLLPFVMLMMLVCSLVILQPDLDTTAIIAITSLTIYYVSGKDRVHTLGSIFIVLSVAVVGVFAAVRASYRLSRVNAYLDFWRTGTFADKLGNGFQVWNGLVAIGSGGLFGLGFTNSRQKFAYLQDAAFTDSIFAIFAEEFGLVGTVLLISAFLYFMYLGVSIANKASDKFSALLAIGITMWITLQAFLNIGANLAVIPFGGIPLPFLSYGGSNTLMILVAVGLLLNVSKHGKQS